MSFFAPMLEYCDITTGKLDSNAAITGGEYPFFTCSPETLRINTFAFDTEAVLLAGNNASGVFSVKYWDGKFNAYQRTYVIQSSDESKLSTRFLFFALQMQLTRLQNLSTGAATKFLTLGILKKIEIPIPDKVEQLRVVNVLSTYDDLIDTNRRRIALLEESARQLYREWFVKLRFPGHELVKVTDGLPEGWELKPIADFVTLLSRGITPKYDDLAKGLVINQKCIREGRLNLAPARRQSKEVKQDKLVQLGDILINSTGAGTLGRVAQVRDEIAECTVDTHVTIVRPKSVKTMGFLGVALLELAPVFESMGRGATNQLELGRVDIGAVQLLTPPNPLQVEFHNIVWPIFEQVNALVNSCDLLAEARDALLPKLMSGQLAV